MIRISRAQRGSDTVVTVAGRLDAAHLEHVEAECEAAGEDVVLDLSELLSADAEGIRWLKAFESRATVTDKSPYIACLLERAEEVSRG